MIYAVGIGPGDPDLLPYKTVLLLRKASVIAGFETVLNVARKHFNPEAAIISMGYKDQPEKMELVGELSRQGNTCVVCFMGDVNFSGYEYLERIVTHCKEPNPEIIPGISSAQIAAGRTRTAFETAVFITFHKRGDIAQDKEFLALALKQGKSAIVIPLPWDFMPADICQYLMDSHISGKTKVEVFEHLTWPTEKRYTMTIADCKQTFSDVSLMVISPSK
ncbi:MAG: precorrin-6y C5,15-methyltransferase (decarboxylating) subunit CbiE [Nitrospinae bacterium RIFCSPLOWO2_12_FULL_47_7]|nr:MAG: precorrin-6y C5,15-methyltransferase (decarboxylating) subunit CbiE [Nitrospinae bacterium RIFCSPLOWO2_12_FULL_47_7]